MENCTRLHTPEVSRSRRRFAGSDGKLASRVGVCSPVEEAARSSTLSTTPVPRSRRDPSFVVAPGSLGRTPRCPAEWSAGRRPVSATCPCSTRRTGGDYLGLYHAQLGRGTGLHGLAGFLTFTACCADRLRGSTPHRSSARLRCRQDAGAARLPMCDAAGNSRGVVGLRKNRSEPTGSPFYMVWGGPAFQDAGGFVRHPVDAATEHGGLN